MANINETPIWRDGVLEIATTDEVKGGPDGVINQQARQLADRTAYLKQQVEAAGSVAADADTKASTVLERITAVEADVGTAQLAAVLASQHKDDARVARDAAVTAQGDAEAAAALAADKAQAAADALDDVFLKNQQTVAAAASAAASAASVEEGKGYILTARGEVLAAVADVEAGAAAAAASVTAATAQADRATTQANLATSNGAAQVTLAKAQVALASGQAAAAASSAFAANTAKLFAESASEAAQLAGKIYDDTTAGLAATPAGEYFSVAKGSPSGTVLDLYKNNAGTAVYVNSFISSVNFDATAASNLSGIQWAVRDEAGKLALYLDTTGALFAPGTYQFNALSKVVTNDLQAIRWAVVDDNNRVALGILDNGNLYHKGVEVDISLLAPDPTTLAALVAATFPTDTVNCWGDSLTNGGTAGVTTPWPVAMQALFSGVGDSRTVVNRGISGMTSQQVSSKFGAKPSLLTVQNNTIPASGPVTVVATENSNLSSKANYGTLTYTGTLAGIPGTLSVGWNSTNPDLAGTTTFTRSSAGSATLIPERSPFIVTTNGWEKTVEVIWVGRNDVQSGTLYADDEIVENIDWMVRFLPTTEKRFIVLGVTEASFDAQTLYDRIIGINTMLVKKYPRNFIDIRKVLVNSYNPALPNDVTAFNNNRIPPSLFQDGLHLNDAGYAVVAQAVFAFINQKGW